MCAHNRPARDRHKHRVQLTSSKACAGIILSCEVLSIYSSIFPMEIYTSESQDWVGLLGTVCIVLRAYTHWRSFTNIPASKCASGGPSFRKRNHYFSASGILLPASGNSNLRQWTSALRQWTISYLPAERKELCADSVKKSALLGFHTNQILPFEASVNVS